MKVIDYIYENRFNSNLDDALKEIKEQVLSLYGESIIKKINLNKIKKCSEAHECCRVTDIKLQSLIKINILMKN